jgi:hypothetical protein
MNKIIGLTALLLATLVSNVAAEMIGLNESTLEGVSGQSGIGINIDKLISIESITYSDEDGPAVGTFNYKKLKLVIQVTLIPPLILNTV